MINQVEVISRKCKRSKRQKIFLWLFNKFVFKNDFYFIYAGENESKETHLVELKRKLSDDVTALKHLGEKCDQLNKKYLKKSEEYAPQHIRVSAAISFLLYSNN